MIIMVRVKTPVTKRSRWREAKPTGTICRGDGGPDADLRADPGVGPGTALHRYGHLCGWQMISRRRLSV